MSRPHAVGQSRVAAFGDDAGWTEYPVLIPTSSGPIGAIITEPAEAPRCALVLFSGGGDSGRSGVNSSAAHAARKCCEHGVMTLRFDYPGGRESSLRTVEPSLDEMQDWLRLGPTRGRRLLTELLASHEEASLEVVEWFSRQADALGLLFAGYCWGGRIALATAAKHPALALACLVPPLGPMDAWQDSEPERGQLDPAVIDMARRTLARTPTLMIVGENDDDAPLRLKEALGSTPQPLDIEVASEITLHPIRSPVEQEVANRHLLEWVARAVSAGPDYSPASLASPGIRSASKP
jgi:dienelactone hydrolase